MRPINHGGLLKYVHGEEYHAYNPDVVQLLQKAVQNGDYEVYLRYAETVNTRPVAMLRDLMQLRLAGEPIPLDEVEPVEAIVKRFDSAGMSLGALSPEAHEALAIAMNRLGGRSNSGEGGEDPARYGTEKCPRSSRWRPAASASRRITWSTPKCCRSRWPRAPSRARRPTARRQGVRPDRRLRHAKEASA